MQQSTPISDDVAMSADIVSASAVLQLLNLASFIYQACPAGTNKICYLNPPYWPRDRTNRIVFSLPQVRTKSSKSPARAMQKSPAAWRPGYLVIAEIITRASYNQQAFSQRLSRLEGTYDADLPHRRPTPVRFHHKWQTRCHHAPLYVRSVVRT